MGRGTGPGDPGSAAARSRLWARLDAAVRGLPAPPSTPLLGVDLDAVVWASASSKRPYRGALWWYGHGSDGADAVRRVRSAIDETRRALSVSMAAKAPPRASTSSSSARAASRNSSGRASISRLIMP